MKDLLLDAGGYKLFNTDGVFIVETDSGEPIERTTIKDVAYTAFNALANTDLRSSYNSLLGIVAELYRKTPRAIVPFVEDLSRTLTSHYTNVKITFDSIVNQVVYYTEPSVRVGMFQINLAGSLYLPYLADAKSAVKGYKKISVKSIDALGDLICFCNRKVKALNPDISLDGIYSPIEDEFFEFYVSGLSNPEIYEHRNNQGRSSALSPLTDMVNICMTNLDANLVELGIGFEDRSTIFGKEASLTEQEAFSLLSARVGADDVPQYVESTLSKLSPSERETLNANDYIATCQVVVTK